MDMCRPPPTRRPTVWTRLTGLLAMAAVYAALIAGALPLALAPDPHIRDLRLKLVGCALTCVLLWVLASVCAPRTDRVVLDKAEQRRRHPSAGLTLVLALAVPLASTAALAQAVGPDGEEGRRVSRIYSAGGGTHHVPIDKVLNAPRETAVTVDGVPQYAVDVTVTVQFDDGPRSVTVHGATVTGWPATGGAVALLYAPGRPGLGVRPDHSDMYTSGMSVPILGGIWSLTLFVAVCPFFFFGTTREIVHTARRFRMDVHGVVAALLTAGVCLLLPGAFFHAPTWAGWLLAVAAASTPWFAELWVRKRLQAPSTSSDASSSPVAA
ncbi:hypothetical protein [Streptomyces sp. NPDC002491]